MKGLELCEKGDGRRERRDRVVGDVKVFQGLRKKSDLFGDVCDLIVLDLDLLETAETCEGLWNGRESVAVQKKMREEEEIPKTLGHIDDLVVVGRETFEVQESTEVFWEEDELVVVDLEDFEMTETSHSFRNHLEGIVIDAKSLEMFQAVNAVWKRADLVVVEDQGLEILDTEELLFKLLEEVVREVEGLKNRKHNTSFSGELRKVLFFLDC